MSSLPRPRRPRWTIAFLAVLMPLTVLPAAVADHADPPGPVNAQSTFKWGRPLWQDDYESGVAPRNYRVDGPGLVRHQFGMLTLNTTTGGTVTATSTRRGSDTGRWEIRLRSRRYSTSAADYKVRTELVPAGDRAESCGAQNVALEGYEFGDKRANLWIRTLPDRQFTASKGLNLADDRWHTFGVEVTPRRISWFVDAHVIRSERRPAALSGIPFVVRFSMVAEPGARMNKSRMQMDWLRYFTLERRNAQSIRAPRTVKSTYADAC
ncbi:MAG: hypothetical protein WBQ50_15685 [Nocardioides sp.]